MMRFLSCSLLCSLLFLGISSRLKAGEPGASDQFGFSGLEIYKVSFRSGNLLAGDLNHDGRTDLAIVDNGHSRIDLFLQRDPDKPVEKSKPLNVNELPSDGRFEHVKLAVDREISSMTLGDFNHDGRTDIAYIGLPDRVIVKFQTEAGLFAETTEKRLADLSQSGWAISAGDLNGDKLDDLVILGESQTYLLKQTEDGFALPDKLMNTSDRLSIAQISDLDGDGRNDLCYLAENGQERLFAARLQNSRGVLGPEIQFDVKRQRSLTLGNIDGEPGDEMLSLDPLTNRVKISKLKHPEAGEAEIGTRLVQYGFADDEGGRDRDIALGDVDGDGRTDLVASDPSSAQIYLFRQTEHDGLDLGTPFPSLQGVTNVAVSDAPHRDVFVLSTREKSIGVSRMEGNRLSIPSVLPVQDEPLVFELADVTGDGVQEVVYISRKKDGRSSEYFLHVLARSADKEWTPKSVSEEEAFQLKLASSPDKIVSGDFNRDGHADFFVSQGNDRPLLMLIGTADHQLKVVETSSGFKLGTVPLSAMFLGSLQKPYVLQAQENFARSFLLNEDSQWELQEQFNVPETNAKITGVAAIDFTGSGEDEIALVDTGVHRLRLLTRGDTGFVPWKELELGEFPFMSSHVADLNGDQRDDLLLCGRNRFAVLYAGRTDPEMQEIASFETELDKVFLSDIVTGDLNGDARPDLAVIDVRSHFIEILKLNAENELEHGLHFKVFESKSFSDNDESGGADPREGIIADVTGDGLADLILLIHDRVLVYPQDNKE